MATSRTRYFIATDGIVTVFRASKTRHYQSASWRRYPGEHSVFGEIGFSAKTSGLFPTREITKVEYERFLALKKARCERDGVSYPDVPSQSWVRNTQLDAASQIAHFAGKEG